MNDLSQNLKVVLTYPSLAQNIGGVARVMHNFGLKDLNLVDPRADHLSPEAKAMATEGAFLLDEAQTFPTLEEAIASSHIVFATTARPRDMNKEVLTPKQAALELAQHLKAKKTVSVVMGSEKSGLDNDHIALAHKIISIPVSPEFTSLNLVQSTGIVIYEITQALQVFNATEGLELDTIAPREELIGFLNHLEESLDVAGYFRNTDKKPIMRRTLYNMFARNLLSSQEIKTLHGVIGTLTNPNGIHARIPKRKKGKS